MPVNTFSPSPELQFALAIAKQAGAAIVKARSALNIQFKDGHELVTQADVEADTIIRNAIQQAWPNHAILSEELAPEQSATHEHLWIVDPIDGTVNYAHQHPNVGISIAYYRNGSAYASVVHNPFLNETFYAQKNAGAWLNEEPIQCAQTGELKRALVATGFPYVKNDLPLLMARLHTVLEHCADVRRLGSAALDICWLACGRLDVYYETVKVWDFAAAQLIAREAGVRFGHIFPLQADQNPELVGDNLLFSVPALFDDVQHLLQQAETNLT